MTIQMALILVSYLAAAGIPAFFLIRKNIRMKKEYKKEVQSLQELNKKLVDTEKLKGEIRNEYGKKEDDIIADPTGDHNVLPVSPKREHNHSFRDTCGKDCPAYSGD